MKAKNLLLIFFFSALLVNVSKAQTVFQKTFGDSLSEYCYAVQQTSDKGFVLAGYTKSYGTGGNNFYIIKTDSLSNIVWSKIYGGPLDDEAFAIKQTTDGGYIMAGYTKSFGVQYYDAVLLKTDANGDTLWTKTYGGLASDYGNTVIQTTDGGYVMAGYTTDSLNIYIVKTDGQGNLLWQKLLGAGTTDAYSIKQTADKGYVITGYTSGYGEVNGDAFLIKTDSLANPIFAKTYGYKGGDWGNSIFETTDGGFIIGGSYSTDSTGLDLDAYMIKTNAFGDTLWTKTFGGSGNDYGQYIKQTTDGGYILGGYTNSFGNGGYDVFMIKVNANGDTIFTKAFGGQDDDEANMVLQTSDGGYLLAGQSNSFGKGDYDFYSIKTDANGDGNCFETNIHTAKKTSKTIITNINVTQNTPIASKLNASPNIYTGSTLTDACNYVDIARVEKKLLHVQVFPNPNNGVFTLAFTDLNKEKVSLCIQNMLGEIVYTANIIANTEINLQHLISGAYFAHIQTADKSYTAKIIVTK